MESGFGGVSGFPKEGTVILEKLEKRVEAGATGAWFSLFCTAGLEEAMEIGGGEWEMGLE